MQNVGALMTENLETASPEENVFQIAEKMKLNQIGAIPICEEQKIVGIVTDRDIVIRSVAERLPGSTPISEIMTQQVISIEPNETIEEASKIMAKHQIRRLPVVNEGILIGMLAIGDLATTDQHDEKAKKALEKISSPTK